MDKRWKGCLMDLETIKNQIEAQASDLHAEIGNWEKSMLAKLEEAKTNEILSAVESVATRLTAMEKNIGPRLDAIEAKLEEDSS